MLNYGTEAQIKLVFSINGILGARPTWLTSMVTVTSLWIAGYPLLHVEE